MKPCCSMEVTGSLITFKFFQPGSAGSGKKGPHSKKRLIGQSAPEGSFAHTKLCHVKLTTWQNMIHNARMGDVHCSPWRTPAACTSRHESASPSACNRGHRQDSVDAAPAAAKTRGVRVSTMMLLSHEDAWKISCPHLISLSFLLPQHFCNRTLYRTTMTHSTYTPDQVDTKPKNHKENKNHWFYPK